MGMREYSSQSVILGSQKIVTCVTLVIILPPWELKLANKVHAEAIRKIIVDLSMEIMNVCTGTLS